MYEDQSDWWTVKIDFSYVLPPHKQLVLGWLSQSIRSYIWSEDSKILVIKGPLFFMLFFLWSILLCWLLICSTTHMTHHWKDSVVWCSFATAATMLCGLLLYDVFWVFGSSHVFGDNVMVTVSIIQISCIQVWGVSEQSINSADFNPAYVFHLMSSVRLFK